MTEVKLDLQYPTKLALQKKLNVWFGAEPDSGDTDMRSEWKE